MFWRITTIWLLLSHALLAQDAPWQRIEKHFQPPAEWANQKGEYRPLLMNDSSKAVTDTKGWAVRRQELLDQWQAAMGPWPDVIANPKVGRAQRVSNAME